MLHSRRGRTSLWPLGFVVAAAAPASRGQREADRDRCMSYTPLVSLEHVDVELAGHRVLRDVDWRLVAGEHWGVVGANGSGKTSFLGLIAGTLWPAPGSGGRRYGFGAG